MSVDPRFTRGLELFNGKEFFECHEVIEELWLETPSEDSQRDLYKGVIQAAAAIYQWERGVLSGAAGLYKTSAQYLKKYEPASLGLNVEKLRKDLDEFFRDPKKEKIPVLEYRR